MSSLTLLRVDASMSRQSSTSRMLADSLIERLGLAHELKLLHRDLADGIGFIDEPWINANFTDPAERDEAARQALAESDILVSEMKQADVLVMSVPIYNFGVPAAFKAWIDQIARARETFQYTDRGPVGLLSLSACYLIVTSGGTPIESSSDYVTGYIRFLFSFLGIRDIEVIACDGLMTEGETRIDQALARIAELPLPV